MKRFIVFFATVVFVACSDAETCPNAEPIDVQIYHREFDTSVRVYTVEGHQYLLIKHCYGAGLVHSESCICKQSK